ncbi:MAG: DoxX family membrane protein [Gemmatimonadetes bacterium]|nr:DoxX family membrane protein [Gemmatimonadota bacterium]NIQ56971.1 DoxX family membrane protein [Gemmatimonadota bacterium]NIU77142.1 DoxX family membrane protein [Gammaproteobacteria bacterium]NIX46463.1 DoxX family membrane protein [Gemmatimonadota bacterium]NIY10778.1 DoxX family membrane protein [Gemmatimonadota bacterium]
MNHRKATNAALWTLQALLAVLFVYAGAFKLMMPAAELAAETGLPGPLMQLVGLTEVAGGLGLLLPGAFRVRRELTPFAASGLIVIMVGAVASSALRISLGAAVTPFVVGLLLLAVVYGRRGWARPGPA